MLVIKLTRIFLREIFWERYYKLSTKFIKITLLLLHFVAKYSTIIKTSIQNRMYGSNKKSFMSFLSLHL